MILRAIRSSLAADPVLILSPTLLVLTAVIGAFSASMDFGTSEDPAVVEKHPFLKLMTLSTVLGDRLPPLPYMSDPGAIKCMLLYSLYHASLIVGKHSPNNIALTDFALPFPANKLVEWGAMCRLNLPLMKKHRETARALHAYVGDIVQERKQNLENNSLTDDQKEDMLTCMLTMPDPETGLYLDEETIRNNLITFFVAGHDSTSTTLATAIYYLSKNPDVEQRVLAEIREVMGSGADAVPNLADLKKLKYTTQVLKEAMRLNPPLIYITRTAIKDTNFGPYFIKEGTQVITMTEALHRNPKLWGDDADRFDPDNFSPEAEASRQPGAWMPFAVGARSCIGMQLAMTEARVALAMLLPRYSFQLHSSANVKRGLDKILTTLEGVEMTVQPRELSQNFDVGLKPEDVTARDAATSNHHPSTPHGSADLEESKCPFQAMFKYLS